MEDRLAVLEAIERGEMSVQQGLRRLEGHDSIEDGTPKQPVEPASQGVRPFLVRIIWQSVFWGGVALLVLAALLVSGSYAWAIPPGWRILGWVLLGLGLVTMMIGWWMRTARWLTIRIRETEGTKLTLAFPLPFGLVYWAMRIARMFAPQVRDIPLEETVVALEESLRDGDPFFVEVHDEEDGDHVQVYFG